MLIMSNIYLAKGNTLRDQYFDIGKLYASEMQVDLNEDTPKHVVAKRVLRRVQTEKVFEKFYECFSAWAAGAQISEMAAMYLMADNLTGCQTMMVRYVSGVGIIHTEEDFNDVGLRLRGEHTIEFNDNGRKLSTLTYNNLMPGSALFGWQKDMIVAVDALFIKEDGIEAIERPMLANIIGWLAWQTKPSDAEPTELSQSMANLGTTVDGYAINIIRRVGNKIQGYKLSFARDEWAVEKLGNKVGSNLRQVNIFEPHYVGENRAITTWQAPREQIEYYSDFALRLQTLNQLANKYSDYLTNKVQKSNLLNIHKQIYNLMFNVHKNDFINEDMGAGCVGIMDLNEGTSASAKLNNGAPLEEIEYLSVVE